MNPAEVQCKYTFPVGLKQQDGDFYGVQKILRKEKDAKCQK